MKIIDLFNTFTSVMKSLEGKITTGTAAALPRIASMVDTIQKEAAKAEIELPAITDTLNGPIGTAIADMIPGGQSERTAVIALINRFQPYLQKAADPAVMGALKQRLTAEILLVENGAIGTIDKAILEVQHFFQAIEG